MSIVPHITIQSASRAKQVPIMLEALKPLTPTWYVPVSQVQEYEDAGAKARAVEGTMPMKTKQLNAALDDGFAEGRIVITMDDDFRKAQSVDWDAKRFKVVTVPLPYVLKEMVGALEQANKMLCINGFVGNLRFARPKPGRWGMGSGQLMAHKPGIVRFDEEMNDTEDLDYIVQHHLVYGGLVKMMKYHCNFHTAKGKSRNYEGGYEGHRTDETVLSTVVYLREKYPFLRFVDVGVNQNMYRNINWRALHRED